MVKVFVSGCFDVLHSGHIRFFEEASQYGDLYVSIGSDKTVEELKKRGRSDILVCIGGVIPPQDYQYLYDHGATAIFGPGTNIPKCCIELLQILVDRAKAEAREG